MKIILANKSPVEADLHQWAEDDIVVVRFDNDEGNIPFETDEEDMVKNNRRVRKRAIGDEKFVWYAGKVKKVSSRGGVIVKLFDKDVVTLTPKEAALEMKRTTKDRLKSLLGKKKYALPITNTDALKLSKGPLVVRTLDKVLDVDSESFEGDLALPVNKMTVDPKALGEAYANHEWLGGWINCPIYDAHKVKHVLPAVVVGFGLVRGKHSLILKADTAGVEGGNFRTPWAVLEVFDRSPQVLFDKVNRMVSSNKSKVGRKRATEKEVLTLRREAKRSKRFV